MPDTSCSPPPRDRVVSIPAPPIDTHARSAEERPPDELNGDYYKVRVLRLMRRKVTLRTATPVVMRWTLRDGEAMIGRQLDPRWGRMFLLVQGPLSQEVSATLDVHWVLPGGVSRYTHLSGVAVAFNQPQEVELWDGPIPGPIEVTLTLVNAGADVAARVTVDTMARRAGSNFDHGMWLDDPQQASGRREQLGPHDPDALREFDPPPRRKPCGAQRPAAQASNKRSAEPVDEAEKGEDTDTPLPSGATRPRPGEKPKPGSWDHIPPCDGAGQLRMHCTPADSAVDWWEAFRAASMDPCADADVFVPDPEVVATLAMLNADLAANGSGGFLRMTPFSFEFDGFVLDPNASDPAPTLVRFPSIGSSSGAGNATLGTSLLRRLGRCVGFDELWDEVSQGLEREKLSPAMLRLLLPQTRSRKSDPWPDLKVTIRLNGESVRSTDWLWEGTAPWLDTSRKYHWYMLSQLNLVSNTLDGLKSIKSPYGRKRRRTFWGRRNEYKHHRVYPSQARWRLQGGWPPFLKIYGGRWRSLEANGAAVYSPFAVSRMSWEPNTGDIAYNLQPDFPASGRTFGLPCPVPSLVRLSEWHWGPHADGAGKLYSFARLLTMMALASRDDDTIQTNYDRLVSAARMAFRAYLTCMAFPGRTLIHEVFHTYRVAETYVSTSIAGGPVLVAMIDNLRRILRALHCLSGCGQEKIATLWFAHLGSRTALLPISTKVPDGIGGVSDHPEAFLSPIGLQTSWGSTSPRGTNVFGSKCRLKGTSLDSIETVYPAWAAEPGATVSLAWRARNYIRPDDSSSVVRNGSASVQFARNCWRSTSRSRTRDTE